MARRENRRRLALGAMALALPSASLLASCQLPGTAFTVTTTVDAVDRDPGDGVCEVTLDAGDCSLRAAVMEANAEGGSHQIDIGDDNVYRLTLAGPNEDAAHTGDLDVTAGLSITGRSIVDGGGLDRVFDVFGSLDLTGTTVRNGRAQATLTLAVGGGIRAQGPTSLTNTTVEANTSMGGGGVYATAPLTVYGSTFDGNQLTLLGSTASAIQVAPNVNVTIRQSTFSGNTAPSVIGGAQGVYLIAGTTFADNAGPAFGPSTSAGISGTAVQTSGPACAAGAIVTSGGYNVLSNSACGLGGVGDVQGTSPIVAPLADNGGATLTDLPFLNSPLLARIPFPTAGLCDAQTSSDQRGQPRPLHGFCDIGSVEGNSTHNGGTVS